MKTLKIKHKVKIKKCGNAYETILGGRQVLFSHNLVQDDTKELRFPLYNAKAKDVGGGLVVIERADGWVLDYIMVEGVESVPVHIIMHSGADWDLVELDNGYLFSSKSSYTIGWGRDLFNPNKAAIVIEDNKEGGVLWIYTGLKS
jgi:hypothetical protein